MAGENVIVAPTSRDISVPGFEKKVKLNTLQAQKVMSRVFTRAAGSLYRIDVILRIIAGDAEAENVEQVIDGMLKDVETDLQKHQNMLAALLEENGIDDLPVYDVPTNEIVRITSPHVGRFTALIQKLDSLIAQIDALWLSGLMPNKERNDEVYRWQQCIIGLGSRIIGIERRARQAARRNGKGDEVDSLVPETNEKEDEQTVATSSTSASTSTSTKTEAEAGVEAGVEVASAKEAVAVG